MNDRLTYLLSALLGILLLMPAMVFAEEPAAEPPSAQQPHSQPDNQVQQTRQRLQDIQEFIQSKRNQVEELRRQLASKTDENERRELERRIEREDSDIINLRRSFENIALGGIDTGALDAAEEEDFNWQQELQLILKPIFQELKDLTEKPRQVERLRSRLALLEDQQRVARRALGNINQVLDDELGEAAHARLTDLGKTWEQRLKDLKREYEINELQLQVLLEEDETIIKRVRLSIQQFLSGRGLNLLLAALAYFATFFLMKRLYLLYSSLSWLSSTRVSAGATGRRMLEYGYQALSILFAILAALLTLYVLGDVLLLVLALIVLLIVLLGLRTYLPQFIDETKLLLNVGAVRERERVVYRGLPWQVRSLGVYSKLYNPALEGLLRLPLSEMLHLVSRPFREDEPWFPTNPEDWVMMEDGMVGQVLRQTPEIVQLRARGTVCTYITTEFLESKPKNLSQGCGMAVTFGIDYQHQAISTTEVPQILYQAIEQGLQEAGFGDQIEKIIVEFQAAGASSLDYLVYILADGSIAGSYYALSRLVQRICVDTCNEQGWVIPFNQLTVHAGSPFVVRES